MCERITQFVLIIMGSLSFVPALQARAAEQTGPGVTRYVRFQSGDRVAYGLLEGDQVRELKGDLFTHEKTDKIYPLVEVKLLVPVQPTKILAMIVNYKSHAGQSAPPSSPEVFYKPLSALLPSGGDIVIPPGTSDVHYEAELVVVIGKRAKNVSLDKAKDYVFGATCGNDVSARDWQKNDKQWWRAKGADTFSPCGPCIVTGLNYDDLQLELVLNGQVKQKARTSELVHSVAECVSYISRFVTLEPGDLIYTGTPGKTEAMKPGDEVEVRIEGIGALKNKVTALPKGP